jgi:MFS transporter, ACS family, glucarate transporter
MKRFRVSQLVLALLCLMYFVTYLDRVNVSTAADGFSRDFQLNRTQIGLVFSAFAYPYLVFQIIGGWVSDRLGARRTLIACGLVWASATILTGMAGGLASLLLARLLLGLGEGATFPAATTAMSRWVGKDRRGYAQGLTHAAARVGNAGAPALVVVIMSAYGWRTSFYACATLSFGWVLLWALTFTEFPKDHPRITAAELQALPPHAGAIQVPWGPLFKRMLPVTVVYFCYGWTLWLFLSWIPQYFLHSHNLDIGKSAAFASGVFFAGVLGDTLGGIVTDRLLTRTGNLNVARSRMVTAVAHSHVGNFAGMPVRRVLFRRDDDRSDVGHSDGYRAGTLGYGQWDDEHRLGPGGHHQSGRVGFPDRPVRQLGAAIPGQHGADGDRHVAGLAHATGQSVRDP